MDVEFKCNVCESILDADDLPYEWNESLDYISLPRLISLDCPVCGVKREFMLDWDIVLEKAHFYDDALQAKMTHYLETATAGNGETRQS